MGFQFQAIGSADGNIVIPSRGNENPVRALSNLLLNAIQWSEADSKVEISCLPHNMTPSLQQIRIEVRDHGPGVNQAKMGRLFQPFMTTRPGGTGLGLANVRKIVEYHGGSVTGSNHPDGGAHFTMTIPCSPPLPGQT